MVYMVASMSVIIENENALNISKWKPHFQAECKIKALLYAA